MIYLYLFISVLAAGLYSHHRGYYSECNGDKSAKDVVPCLLFGIAWPVTLTGYFLAYCDEKGREKAMADKAGTDAKDAD